MFIRSCNHFKIFTTDSSWCLVQRCSIPHSSVLLLTKSFTAGESSHYPTTEECFLFTSSECHPSVQWECSPNRCFIHPLPQSQALIWQSVRKTHPCWLLVPDVSRIALRQKHGRKQGKNELYIVQNNMVHTCVHPLNSYAPRTFKSHMAGVMTLRWFKFMFLYVVTCMYKSTQNSPILISLGQSTLLHYCITVIKI